MLGFHSQRVHPYCWLVISADDFLFNHLIKLCFEFIFEIKRNSPIWMSLRLNCWFDLDLIFKSFEAGLLKNLKINFFLDTLRNLLSMGTITLYSVDLCNNICHNI